MIRFFFLIYNYYFYLFHRENRIYQFFFSHVQDVCNSTTLCTKKKIGQSHGPNKLPDGKKSKVGTNEYGEQNSSDEDCKTLITSIGIMSRTHILIIYQDFREVPNSLIERIVKKLEVIHASMKTYL